MLQMEVVAGAGLPKPETPLSEADYLRLAARFDALWSGPATASARREMDLLIVLIEAYESGAAPGQGGAGLQAA
ncbi:hypothetical protein OOT46_24910 [Aquabacterium sp. A7-Y]|uniref:hypothetical protein n=1 Tax=Aquabacterium sp. A7-Y TaxID=1349605 RepID=UPI00223D3465|nr:hypothetical protein [Aquabacterium sp. A7-Y]MCW7541063.1 hypothetical protein [Aquabacterium sp. A7-Y]